ncbi:PAS domain-containing protein [Persephonella atlantica]|uniref:PAS domain-containing protein n=1 Tax=Persephonella atlantica TaxID=2699429 RepID=A0ABS1GJV3_9AQUI|nr:PAS domain-containing protein [Persephonella atlantica]MBK3333012.1 PAS domain-containing protein [Persephonella atlantica]
MGRAKPQPINRESEFKKDEIFFSCTDLKGIILSGNDVFERVSKYSMEELVGSPHNIIRHPDMPRIVFKLLWDYIQSGKSIVAYVKNMAKDGSYYWVLATVMPVKDSSGEIKEYISIRIKPTSSYFSIIPQLYKDMLKAEKEGGMDASYRVLIDSLHLLGYESYDEFMKDVLIAEMKDKSFSFNIDTTHYGNGYQKVITESLKLYNQIEKLFLSVMKFENLKYLFSKEAEEVYKMADEIRLTALNSSIESMRLGSKGAVFSVISAEMRKNSEEESKIIREMRELIKENTEEIRDIVFTITLSKLEIVMLMKFLASLKKHQNRKKDIDNFYFLLMSSHEFFNQLSHLLLNSFDNLESIDRKIKTLKTLIEELEAMYFRGLIESGYFENTNFSIIYTDVKNLATKNKNNILQMEKSVTDILEKRFFVMGSIEKIKTDIEHLKKLLNSS